MFDFYSNFVNMCAAKNMSPSGVATAIGLSNAAANGWKKGKMPSDTTLAKLSMFFGCSVAELTGEKEKPVPEDESNKAALIAAIENMSRDELLATLEAVTQKLKEK